MHASSILSASAEGGWLAGQSESQQCVEWHEETYSSTQN